VSHDDKIAACSALANEDFIRATTLILGQDHMRTWQNRILLLDQNLPKRYNRNPLIVQLAPWQPANVFDLKLDSGSQTLISSSAPSAAEYQQIPTL
jgi:hypothetical protein